MIEENKTEPKVKLSYMLERQLRLLGLPTDSYTHGQLEAAVQATKIDPILIEDENDPTFFGKLVLTDAEKRKAECQKDNCNEKTGCPGKFTEGIKRKKKTASYRELIKESRENGEAARECDI